MAKRQMSAIRPLWLTGRSFGGVRSKPLQEEFADQIRRRISARVRQAIQKDQRSPAVGRRVVEVRNSACGEVAKHVRIVWPPPPIVVSGHHRGRYRVQGSRPNTSFAFIEVAWVLVKDRRVNSSAQHVGRNMGCEGSAVSLSISFNSASICGENILVLLRACNSRNRTVTRRGRGPTEYPVEVSVWPASAARSNRKNCRNSE